jgi:hypothetical protein
MNLIIAIVKQSIGCHPDWTLQDHLAYLLSEEGFSPSDEVSYVTPFEGVATITVEALVIRIIAEN